VARYPSGVGYSFGPGGISPAVKILIIANVVLFVLNVIVGEAMTIALGLSPQAVFTQFALWQPFTYMFLHSTSSFGHILFNMLALWMIGTDLERTWGTRFFVKYYVITGMGAAATSLLLSIFSDAFYYSITVGASGAIYGLLIAYAIFFPNRIIYYFIFPIPVRIYVLLAGILVLYESARGGGGVAHFAHLGGLIFGYLYLSMGRGGPWAEIKYRYVKWRMNRLKKRFDVHEGGRRWDSRVH